MARRSRPATSSRSEKRRSRTEFGANLPAAASVQPAAVIHPGARHAVVRPHPDRRVPARLRGGPARCPATPEERRLADQLPGSRDLGRRFPRPLLRDQERRLQGWRSGPRGSGRERRHPDQRLGQGQRGRHGEDPDAGPQRRGGAGAGAADPYHRLRRDDQRGRPVHVRAPVVERELRRDGAAAYRPHGRDRERPDLGRARDGPHGAARRERPGHARGRGRRRACAHRQRAADRDTGGRQVERRRTGCGDGERTGRTDGALGLLGAPPDGHRERSHGHRLPLHHPGSLQRPQHRDRSGRRRASPWRWTRAGSRRRCSTRAGSA